MASQMRVFRYKEELSWLLRANPFSYSLMQFSMRLMQLGLCYVLVTYIEWPKGILRLSDFQFLTKEWSTVFVIQLLYFDDIEDE